MNFFDMNNKDTSSINEMLVVEKRKRDQLLQVRKTFKEFSQFKGIPEEYYKIIDSYKWITLCFEMKSGLRDDLVQHYEFTCFASGICTFEVEFKTPKLLTYKGKECDAETYNSIAFEYSAEDVRFSREESSEYYDSVLWNAEIIFEETNPDIGIISDAFEKLRSEVSSFTRTIELEFWNSFDKSQISVFITDQDEFGPDLSADYELYEGDTFIGIQAYMRVITELSSEDIVMNKYNDDLVLESTEFFAFTDKAKKHTYIFEPTNSGGYLVKEQVLNDNEEERYVIGEVGRISENAICCCFADHFCRHKGKKETIIVSYDTDAIRAFISPNMLIATIRKAENDESAVAFEGTTMMKCKYVVHTEQYYTDYMHLVASIPYLNFTPKMNEAYGCENER